MSGLKEASLKMEKSKLMQIRVFLESKTDDDSLDDLLKHMDIGDPNKFRKKMKGFGVIPPI